MFARLKELGFKVMLAQHPFISRESINYELFRDLGYLNHNVGESRLIYDHSNPEAREHWWSRIKEFYDDGIKGYWTDMGELEEHHIGTKSYLGDRDNVHNIYMTLWTKGLYEGQRRDHGERFFALNRATYPGIQRYGTVLWSGDIDASWEVMKEQVVIGQGVAMWGIHFWSTDIGGFLTIDGYTPELFVRWLQWNVFCPVFRIHSTRPGNEIWSFGEQTEKIARYFIKMRYQLLPYIYSMADKIRKKGAPIMRAMAMDYGDDAKAANSVYQFMFGDSILVSPVLDKGQRVKKTYLPEGVWYDYYTGSKYEGLKTINTSAPLEKLSLFIKGGSIIPTANADDQLSISKKWEKNIILNVYPGQYAYFNLYDDDGVTFDYENSGYVRTPIIYEEIDDKRMLKITKSQGKVRIERNYTVVFHDIDHPIGLENYEYFYDKDLRRLEIRNIVINSDQEKEIFFKVSPKSQTIKQEASLENVRFFIDTYLENEGRLSLNVVWENDYLEYRDYIIKAKFETDNYWSIEKEDHSFHNSKLYSKQMIHHEEVKEKSLGGTGSISWTAIPIARFLPARNKGNIIIEIYDEDSLIYMKEQEVSWGSGFVTRWSVVSCFRNQDGKSLDRVFEPEIDCEKPYYIYEGEKLPWIKDNLYEFNCFGYVELRRYGFFEGPGLEGINGITYLKTNAYCNEDVKAYLNISGELQMKVWLNGELVHSSYDIVIDRIEPKALRFKKGYNRLMVKVGVYTEKPYSGREFGFNLRLVDADGKPLSSDSIIFGS